MSVLVEFIINIKTHTICFVLTTSTKFRNSNYGVINFKNLSHTPKSNLVVVSSYSLNQDVAMSSLLDYRSLILKYIYFITKFTSER